MYEIFTKMLNMSLSAGILVIAVVFLRIFLRNVPKKYMCSVGVGGYKLGMSGEYTKPDVGI